MRSLLPPNLVLLLLVAMGVSTAVVPGAVVLDGWWRLIGCLPTCVGAAITIGGSRRFDRVGTNIKTFDDPDLLVTTGLFGLSRNPMYLGFTMLLIGVAIMLGSWTAAVGPLVFFSAADRWYIPFEERRMAATFGADFENYRRSVFRWIGRRSIRREVTT